MSRPEVSDAAEELFEALDPAFTTPDEANGWALLHLCAALVGGDIDQVHSYVTDGPLDEPSWQILLDPDRCPAEALPYLAQFAGARLTPDMSEDQRRDAIRSPEVFRRGTPGHIVAITKRRLTGTKTVFLTERYTGLAYRMQVLTLQHETPSAELTEAELRRESKPIGITLFFNDEIVWDWTEVQTQYATWAEATAAFDTWLDFRTNLPAS